MSQVLANPLYYLDNFQLVLTWVRERYSDLLTPEEYALIERFPLLPTAARALFVRMVMRRGRLFRTSKLIYKEIGPVQAAAAPLLQLGWIDNNPLLCLEQLFDVLHKTEIGVLFHLSPQQKNARKAIQLAALRPQYTGAFSFSAWCGHSSEQIYRILNKPLCDRLRLLFFGNVRQDWSEFVLADLGLCRYEKVEFSASSRSFRKRRDIDDYLQLQRCRERFFKQEPLADLLRDLNNVAMENDWLASRREKLRFQIAHALEKSQNWDAAFALYASCTHPGARSRAIRVLEKSGRPETALEWLASAQSQPENAAEAQQLARMAPRLAHKLGQSKPAPQPPTAVPQIYLTLPPERSGRVELSVRDHMHRADAPVYYVENSLINSLFGLLCWRAIFMPLPGAFFHPFQRGPADLHSADFYRRRAVTFSHCMAELASEQYQQTIRANYAAKAGIESPFVVWSMLDQPLLELALTCIPASHLKQCFERILLDMESNRSGFPDLIQFWPAERRYNMIEVKGPGDHLQDNQQRWIAYFSQHAIPVTVCYLQ